jgi:hypothetical protein
MRLAAIILAILAFASGSALAASRVALVIGNSAYADVPRLNNPENDAKAIGEVFARLGFEVTEKTDLDFASLNRTLRDFAKLSRDADMAVIYYAGHGIEVDKQNFLIPTDAKLAGDDDVEFETVSLDQMNRAVAGASELSLVMIDACRDNPFANQMSRRKGTRSIGRGLARVDPTQGTLVAFAAQEGTTAEDGDGKHSPFASALLETLEEPGLDIRILFGKVRDTVMAATNNRQRPFTYGSLPGREIFLHSLGKLDEDKPRIDPIAKINPKETGTKSKPDEHAALSTGSSPLAAFGPGNHITGVAIAPTDPMVAVLTYRSGNNELSIWNYVTGKDVVLLADNLEYAQSVSWSDNGRIIYVRENTRILAFHVESGDRKIIIDSSYPILFYLNGSNGNEWVGMPFPVPLGTDPTASDFIHFNMREKYMIDEFGYFVQSESTSKKGGSLSLSPKEIEANRNARDRLVEFMERSSACSDPTTNLVLGEGTDRAVLLDDKSFCVWNPATGQPLQAIRHTASSPVESASASRDGAMIALGLESGDTEIWDTENWALIRTMSGHKSRVTSVNFDSTGSRVVTSGDDGRVIVWDVLRGKQIERIDANEGGSVGESVFAHDGVSIIYALNGLHGRQIALSAQ